MTIQRTHIKVIFLRSGCDRCSSSVFGRRRLMSRVNCLIGWNTNWRMTKSSMRTLFRLRLVQLTHHWHVSNGSHVLSQNGSIYDDRLADCYYQLWRRVHVEDERANQRLGLAAGPASCAESSAMKNDLHVGNVLPLDATAMAMRR